MSMTLDDPQVCIPDLIANHARVQPAREAVVCGAVRRSWGDFDRNISRIANALLAAGLARGDRVAVMMGNRVEMLEAVFGIVRAGGCAVPLSGLLTGPQLAGLVADSGAVGAFATADFRARLDALPDALPGVRAAMRVAVEEASRSGPERTPCA